MDYVIIGAQLILSLSILVILHEFGHFIPAKLFKTKVEKFYLFFDPWFSLFKYKKGETEYGVGWLPLGGYVKIAGMVDESMDTEKLKEPVKDWEFRAKPAWQRLIIMLGGVIVNFILGGLIFAFVLWHYGEAFLPADEVKYGITVDSIGEELGLQDGDKILAIGDKEVTALNAGDLIRGVVLDDVREITVERDSRMVKIDIHPRYVSTFSKPEFKENFVFLPRQPIVIDKVVNESPADGAGLQPGDSIVMLNGDPHPFLYRFSRELRRHKNEEVSIGFYRNGRYMESSFENSESGLIGIQNKPLDYFFDLEKKNYGLLASIPAGFEMGYDFLATQLKAFGKMFSNEISVTDSLGGFGTISQLFPTTWEWEAFWRVTAILSIILGFMNLLPIPALDGGHVMFLLYEMITGRKPSDKFLEYATITGFIILIALMLFANGLDVIRALG